MSKEQIIDYVMKTPQNTNKMVLNQMLEDYKNEYDLIFEMGDSYFEDDFSNQLKEVPLTKIKAVLKKIWEGKEVKIYFKHEYKEYYESTNEGLAFRQYSVKVPMFVQVYHCSSSGGTITCSCNYAVEMEDIIEFRNSITIGLDTNEGVTFAKRHYEQIKYN